jgi:ubiquinone/menaquinone biosynthesis C-methylase UbiE
MSAPATSKPAMSYEEFLEQVYTSPSLDKTEILYDQWASNYDRDLSNEGYASPFLSVQAVVKHFDRTPLTSSRLNGELTILDAGCGTGQVGICLASAKKDIGPFELKIDGLDLSAGMREVARKTGVYRKLEAADLSKALSMADESYDIVTCVGTLTKAHVGASVLREFVRVAKRGWGLVAATVHNDIWESGGYKAVIDDMEKFGRVEIMMNKLFDIWKEDNKNGRMIVLRRKYLAQEIAHAGIGA